LDAGGAGNPDTDIGTTEDSNTPEPGGSVLQELSAPGTNHPQTGSRANRHGSSRDPGVQQHTAVGGALSQPRTTNSKSHPPDKWPSRAALESTSRQSPGSLSSRQSHLSVLRKHQAPDARSHHPPLKGRNPYLGQRSDCVREVQFMQRRAAELIPSGAPSA